MPPSTPPSLKVLLAAPRGFCAGVDRAILIVERAIAKWGAPVYVRHEIVHNQHVVRRLEQMGAVFVEELEECPIDRPVVFSAHGVPKAIPAAAERRNMVYIDATCPLVTKVHVEAERHFERGKHIILIGHAGHPEVVGTLGQLPDGAITLVETVADIESLTVQNPDNLAVITQTTLSIEDTAEMMEALIRRFPTIATSHKEDICYATTNRQQAVREIAPQADLVLVIGASNSSNSVRLVEVALRAGAPSAYLIGSVEQLDWNWLEGVRTVGITAGASAPEVLVQELVDALSHRFAVTVQEASGEPEAVTFKLPRILA